MYLVMQVYAFILVTTMLIQKDVFCLVKTTE